MSISLNSTIVDCIIPCAGKTSLFNKDVDPICQGILAGDPRSLQV